jgi:hypothetical protein
MRATAGDRISIPGRHVGDVDRAGEVKEVRGTADSPLYVVAWDDGTRGSAARVRRRGCTPPPQ